MGSWVVALPATSTRMASVRSAAVRASGPGWGMTAVWRGKDDRSVSSFVRRQAVGFIPKTPQKAAGRRTLPPKSAP